MKKLIIETLSLLVLTLLASCGNNPKAAADAVPTVTDTLSKPDARFASIDTLVTFMTDGQQVETIDDLEKRYKDQTAAIKSYWSLNHQGEDEPQQVEAVCIELNELADSLAGGSTSDMVQCGQIKGAVSRYLTARDYCDQYSDNPLYQQEMSDWLMLEKELSGLYVDLAYLAYWGGTIAHVVASGSLAYLADVRQQDYWQLKRGGQFAGSEMTIAEARANLIEELSSAKSLEDDAVEENVADFRKTLNEMREHADKLVKLLDKWLESRARLSEAEGIPEAHTAQLMHQLSRCIMETIEG